jgi:hypothetical protein
MRKLHGYLNIASLSIPWAGPGEVADKLRITGNRRGERGFLRKQQVAQERVHLRLHVAHVPVGGEHLAGFHREPGDVVVHVGLMLHHHQRGDVAARTQMLRQVKRPLQRLGARLEQRLFLRAGEILGARCR